MSKPKKLKFKDFIYKPLINFVLIQTAILLLFLGAYNKNASISSDDCYSSSIIVEEKTLSTGYKLSNFYIVFQGESYQFSEANYKAKELDKLISVGDSIDIHYIKSNGGFLVVDARYKNQTYVDISEYKRESKLSNIVAIISFSIVEFIFLLLCDIKFYLGDAKQFFQNLKKKIDKRKKHIEHK